MKWVPHEIEQYIDLDGEIGDVIERLKKIQQDNLEFAPLSIEVDCEDKWGHKGVEVYITGRRKETRREANLRLEKEREKSKRVAEDKRAQYERLKKELGE